MIILECNQYINREYNFLLTESRVFCVNTGEMLNAHLQVIDLNTMKHMDVEKYPDIDDDVWSIDWEKIK